MAVIECVFNYDEKTGKVLQTIHGLAQFVNNAGKDPDAALKHLSNFTAKIVSTFNHGLGGNLAGGDEVAMLGSALLTEVTIALAQAINATVPQNSFPTALFSLSIPQPSANISLDDLNAGNFKPEQIPEQILVEQKLYSPRSDFAKTALVGR